MPVPGRTSFNVFGLTEPSSLPDPLHMPGATLGRLRTMQEQARQEATYRPGMRLEEVAYAAGRLAILTELLHLADPSLRSPTE